MNKPIAIININNVTKKIPSDEWQRHLLPTIPVDAVTPRRNYKLLFITASGICYGSVGNGKFAGFDIAYSLKSHDGVIKVDRFDLNCISDEKISIEKVSVKKFPSFHHIKENEIDMKYPEYRENFYIRLINCLKNREIELIN